MWSRGRPLPSSSPLSLESATTDFRVPLALLGIIRRLFIFQLMGSGVRSEVQDVTFMPA